MFDCLPDTLRGLIRTDGWKYKLTGNVQALATTGQRCIHVQAFTELTELDMSIERTPLILRAWLIGTQVCAPLIGVIMRHMHRRMGADPARFAERLGQGAGDAKGDVIWFHAASLGEVAQIGPLAKHLMAARKAEILVTTMTAAGADWVARELPEAHHRYVPMDTPRAVKTFLAAWSIEAAVFIEGDLWPRLVQEVARQKIPLVLLNARPSRTRARLGAVFATLLASFALVTCRTASVANEMRRLGLEASRVKVLPDLRLSLPKLPVDQALVQLLSDRIGRRPFWLAASTHPDDEAAVLAAHEAVLQAVPNALLVLAPRHPRRGAPLVNLAQERGWSVAQRSLRDGLSDTVQVYVADTLGELGAFYTCAPVAFLGGSFGAEGGHNPYEPASFGTAILHGPNVKNFAQAYADLNQKGAALRVPDHSQLGAQVLDVLRGAKSDAMAQSGLSFMADADTCLMAYAALVEAVLQDG